MSKKRSRSKGERFSRCRLCLTESYLCKSHVVPEFAYRDLYDDDHRMVMHHVAQDVSALRGKGFHEPLLCRKCEVDMSRLYESPVSELWPLLAPPHPPTEPELVTGLPYRTLKLFALLVLWRAHHSTIPMFGYVNLPCEVERDLRRRLITGDAGPLALYPVVVFRTVDQSGASMPFVATPLTTSDPRRPRLYSLAFGGLNWLVHLASPERREQRAERIGIQEDGSAWIGVFDFRDTPTLIRAREIEKSVRESSLTRGNRRFLDMRPRGGPDSR